MRAGFPDFRLGNVLATSFTGTLSERHGDAVERIPTPQRLVDWLAVNGFVQASVTEWASAACIVTLPPDTEIESPLPSVQAPFWKSDEGKRLPSSS